MSKQPNPKTYLLLTIGALLAGAGATYWAYTGMGDQAAKVEALRKETESEEQVNQQLRKSQEELAKIAQRLGHLEDGVTAGAYLPTMLRELEATGRRCGLEVLGVRPQPTRQTPSDKPEEKKPYRELDIEIKCRGSYGAALRFVQALDVFPKVVAARGISLLPKSDNTGNGVTDQLEVTMTLRAFVFREEQEKASGAREGATAFRSEGMTHGG